MKTEAVMKSVPGNITAPEGFKAAGVRCNIKTRGRDLALVYSETPASAAAVFTTNRVKAAPVLVSQKHLAAGSIRAIVANSGNANACTGERGLKDARRMAELAASELGLKPEQVLVCSTGVIGHTLPMDKIESGIRKAARAAASTQGTDAAEAIMTTDTRPKEIALEFDIGGFPVRIGGIAKGSGMICPNMATMLAFITTDATVKPSVLDRALKSAVEKSFNCVTVDGDGSTNDTAIILANGASGAPGIESGEAASTFCQALDAVCIHLAREMARDGEGATKLVNVVVEGAASLADAKQVAKTVANSNLVKTALFGNDPNWGRILAAAGRSGVNFDPARTTLSLCGTQLIAKGEPVAFDAPAVSKAMRAPEIEIRLSLGHGKAAATVWTCDFSYDYVRINAEYHT